MDLLFEIIRLYGWQALIVSLFVFAFIECLKPLARKLIKNENGRHCVYTALNYVITLGFSALWAWILGTVDKTFQIYGSAIVVVNILYPIISNAGFFDWIAGLVKEFYQTKTELGSWKKAIGAVAEEFGVDSKMLDTVASKVETEYKEFILNGVDEFFGENKSELVLNMQQKLAGFVENTDLEAIAEKLFEALYNSWAGSKKEEKPTDDVGEIEGDGNEENA